MTGNKGPDSTKELKAPWTGETYFTVKPKEFDPLEDSDYEPEGDDELADDSGPSDHGEDEYSNVPAMPAQKVDPASKAPKFGPVSKPGIFLGYRLEPGGQWKGDYYVADLEHFRNGFSRPSVHQVKRIWRNPEEGYVFPMLAAYERLTREVQLLDTGEGKGLPKADAPTEPDDQLNTVGPDSDHPNDDSSDPAVDSEAPANVPERALGA